MERDSDASDSSLLLEEHGIDEKLSPWKAPARARCNFSSAVVTTIIIILVVSNSILLFRGSRFPWFGKDTGSISSYSYYSAAPIVPVPFSHQWVGLHNQESPDYRYKDEEWIDLFPDFGGIVALSSDFRTEHSLPETAAPSPEDEDKKLYYIAGYHQLHCLMVVRDAIYYLNGTITWPESDPSGFIWDHVLHCIEAVRIGLTCFLDDTLINLNETWPGVPNGQMHQCRNRDALRAFADEHGHEAPVDPDLPMPGRT